MKSIHLTITTAFLLACLSAEGQKSSSFWTDVSIRAIMGVNYNFLSKTPGFIEGFDNIVKPENIRRGLGFTLGVEAQKDLNQRLSAGVGTVLRHRSGALRNYDYYTLGTRIFPSGLSSLVFLSEVNKDLKFNYLRLEVPAWIAFRPHQNWPLTLDCGAAISPLLWNFSRERGEERVFTRLVNAGTSIHADPVDPNEYISLNNPVDLAAPTLQINAFAGINYHFLAWDQRQMSMRIRYVRHFTEPLFQRGAFLELPFVAVSDHSLLEISLTAEVRKSVKKKR